MLTKARLNDKVIEVDYYFPEFNGTTDASADNNDPNSRDHHVNANQTNLLREILTLPNRRIKW
jgi:hypothetical protein